MDVLIVIRLQWAERCTLIEVGEMKTLIAVLACLLWCPVVEGDEFSMDEFRKLHAELVPQNEAWKTIPWQTDLLKAQRLAAKENKLIFIWAMDGHPLGCT